MGNISEFKQKTYTSYTLKITYLSGEEEFVEATLFGEMEILGGFIGFSSTPPDSPEDVPSLMIKADTVKKVTLIGTKEKSVK